MLVSELGYQGFHIRQGDHIRRILFCLCGRFFNCLVHGVTPHPTETVPLICGT
jgi:hypothetical protein